MMTGCKERFQRRDRREETNIEEDCGDGWTVLNETSFKLFANICRVLSG